ncbi:CYFA0S21e01211g1_1 [Cyberlindnera fabianii]|uniref:CYFA0S21e01211g1_1 n=1 Tax=Cyberlindnera fabianii TaxID=36022 RepID=A0A061BGD1_CYBFA|nr:CYFA0S21e01211g1_1 [Cyberlindnera fabianii]
MITTKQRTSDSSPSWAITTVIGLICLRIALYCFEPEGVSGRTTSSPPTRHTVLKEQEELGYQFDTRLVQEEAAHETLSDWDDGTVFLRFEEGSDKKRGFYALKKGDVYVRKTTDDDSLEEILYEGGSLVYNDEELHIDGATVSPDLKALLLMTNEGSQGCGVFWLWDVATRTLTHISSEKLCHPQWSIHSRAIVFGSAEISPNDVYFYYVERSQLVHHHRPVNSVRIVL